MELDDSPLANRRLSTVGDVRRALNPLQAQADRVGRQVEQFAETLDRLNPYRDGERVGVSSALPLIQAYEEIASETVKRLKRRHGDEQRQLLKQARRRLSSKTGPNALVLHGDEHEELAETTGQSVKDLEHWQNEQQTWQLLGLMLQVQHPATPKIIQEEGVSLQRPEKSSVHRYSAGATVYNNYLATDDGAWEKHVITQWLSRVADCAEEDIYEVVEDLIDAEGETEALNAHGWVRAKENIKLQKRLRSWNRPLNPDVKEADTVFSGKKQDASQITQLDPDAPSRQHRDLLKEDSVFEHAIWVGIWELVKRGRPWMEILDWCKERSETWRALSLRSDPRLQTPNHDQGADIRGHTSWQQSCLQLSTAGGIDDYERAIYGLLGGNEKSVMKICKTWNEQLYAVLSCQITQGYGRFLDERFGLKPGSAAGQISSSSRMTLQHVLDRLASKDNPRSDTQSQLTMLQTSIMTGQTVRYIVDQGSQLSAHLQKGRQGGLSSNAAQNAETRSQPSVSTLKPEHYDMIRILAHLVVIFSVSDSTLASSSAAENLIVSYADYLGRAGKQQLLPLYASRLSKDRAAMCMARQLVYIKDAADRQTLMRLMKQFDMEHEIILMRQLEVIIQDSAPNLQSRDGFPTVKILDNRHVDIPGIKRNFMGKQVKEWERDLIDCLEWFLLLDGQWEETLLAGVTVYKHFIRTQSWAAASELAHKIPFSRISMMKTRKMLGEEIDLSAALTNGDHAQFNSDGMDQDMDDTETRHFRAQTRQSELLKHARTFRDLESVVLALEAISEWELVMVSGQEARVQAHEGNKTGIKDWKKDLTKAHEAVSESVEPLLHGWLLSPKDDSEAAEIAQIRIHMLPEIILAYLSIQAFGGKWLHRDHLLQCMSLAIAIARPEDTGLQDVFVEAGRVAELSLFMAHISRLTLSADESTGGKPLAKKRRGDGEVLDIWTISSEAAQ